MCLTAESASNVGNLISPKFCVNAHFKVCNVNINSSSFLDILYYNNIVPCLIFLEVV